MNTEDMETVGIEPTQDSRHRLDPVGVSAAAKADAAAALATMTVDLSRRERERAVEIVLHHVAVAGSPAGGNPHRRDAERLRALNPPLLEAAADADKRADEWDATFAAGLAAGRAEASPADERLREALRSAKTALRAHRLSWIALSDRLDTPYPDHPDLSPWSRFALPACQRGKLVEDEIAAVLALAGVSAEAAPDDGCRAPHCWSEYGTPCGACPVVVPPPNLHDAPRADPGIEVGGTTHTPPDAAPSPNAAGLAARDTQVNDLLDQVQMYEEKAERDWRDFGEIQDARIAADDRVVELTKALEFYADADNYVGGEVGWWGKRVSGDPLWCMDFGVIARNALAGVSAEATPDGTTPTFCSRPDCGLRATGIAPDPDGVRWRPYCSDCMPAEVAPAEAAPDDGGQS